MWPPILTFPHGGKEQKTLSPWQGEIERGCPHEGASPTPSPDTRSRYAEAARQW